MYLIGLIWGAQNLWLLRVKIIGYYKWKLKIDLFCILSFYIHVSKKYLFPDLTEYVE